MEPENKISFFEAAQQTKKPVEVDEDFYWYVIEVLPPIYAKGWVGLGEPYSHTSDDKIITYWVCKRGEKYFCFFGTCPEAEATNC
jgi:hypothetical protein